MAEINWDAIEAPKDRVLNTVPGSTVDVEKEIPKAIRERLELLLAINVKRPAGTTPQYKTQNLPDNDAAKLFAKLAKKYGKYRPAGQITVRVSNDKDIKAGTATHVDYTAKELESKAKKPGAEVPQSRHEGNPEGKRVDKLTAPVTPPKTDAPEVSSTAPKSPTTPPKPGTRK